MNFEISGSNPLTGQTEQVGWEPGLFESMYSEEALTLCFKTLPRAVYDHVVAAEHLRWFFIPHSFCRQGKE